MTQHSQGATLTPKYNLFTKHLAIKQKSGKIQAYEKLAKNSTKSGGSR
jgi:hypothetical protein